VYAHAILCYCCLLNQKDRGPDGPLTSYLSDIVLVAVVIDSIDRVGIGPIFSNFDLQNEPSWPSKQNRFSHLSTTRPLQQIFEFGYLYHSVSLHWTDMIGQNFQLFALFPAISNPICHSSFFPGAVLFFCAFVELFLLNRSGFR
jgi:hypothetical protein